MKKIKAVKRKRIRMPPGFRQACTDMALMTVADTEKLIREAELPPPVARPTAWLDLFVITSAMVAIAAMVVILVNEAWG